MENKKLRIIIVSLILLSFLVLCLLLLLIVYNNLNNNTNTNISFTTTNNEDLGTEKEVLEEYECVFWRQEDNYFYVTFSKDLFDSEGNSNESYFKNIVKGLERFFPNTDFYIIDYNKDINIYAKFDKDKEKHILIINSSEAYYSQVDGKDYINVDKVNYSKEANSLVSIDTILTTLKNNNMKFSSIKSLLGEGKELTNGYVSYLDNTVKIRIVNKAIVRNIVFSRDYKEKIFNNFDNNASLEEIYNVNPDNCFGGSDQGYLGYRTDLLYYFIYDDEISVYGYSYKKNSVFEETLKKYIEDKDLERFTRLVAGQVPTYDYFEYDKETESANIMLSSYGIEIKIVNNDSRGVVLYNNYFFTDSTKELVKNGLISFNNNEDLIEKIENERRNNKGR